MAVSIQEQAAWLAAVIRWRKRWATPEETAAWLETETGQRIAALIDREREQEEQEEEGAEP